VNTPPSSSFSPADMPLEQARAFIAARLKPLAGSESVALRHACGRVLAEDVVSPIDTPAHDNSAMDGYAFAGALLGDAETTLRIVGTALAGRPFAVPVAAGECVRIMTGAVMPEGCDTVIAQEHVKHATPEAITIGTGSVRPGDNRRRRGEDIACGSIALRAGHLLHPADLGLLASLGIATAAVKPRLRVACFSTGDELRAPGQPLEPGCIYDSNRYVLVALLERLGCDVIDLGALRDDPVALEAALREAIAQADAVITSGGAAAGDADHTAKVMSRLGEVAFWKMAVRPGRPFAFGRIPAQGRDVWLFGLPGNPVAAMVSFCFLVRPALLQLAGMQTVEPLVIPAIAGHAIRKKAGRSEFQRGIVGRNAHGALQVRLSGAQGSGVLRSMADANCIVVLAQDRENVAAGETVDVVLLDCIT